MRPAITASGIAATRTQASRLQGMRIPSDSRSIAVGRKAECFDGAAEVRRRLGGDLQFSLARRMWQQQPTGMEMQSTGIGDGGQKRFLAAVFAIAQDGAADRGTMNPQLMRPACARPQ